MTDSAITRLRAFQRELESGRGLSEAIGVGYGPQGRTALRHLAADLRALLEEREALVKVAQWARTCVPFPSDCHAALNAALAAQHEHSTGEKEG